MEVPLGTSTAANSTPGVPFQQVVSISTSKQHTPIWEGTDSPDSATSSIMARSGFAVTSTPQAHLSSPLPALSTVHHEKPLPIRHRHGRKASKPCRALPKAAVKIIRKPVSQRRKPAAKKKKPTSQKKRQRSVRNSGNARLIWQGPAPACAAHGSLEGAANPSRPLRERKPNRQLLDFETESDSWAEASTTPNRETQALKGVLQNSPALRGRSPESPTSGDSAQEGLAGPTRRALRPAPRQRTSSSPEPEPKQDKQVYGRKHGGMRGEGKKKAGGPCAVCFNTVSSTWRRGSAGGMFPEEPLCNAHGTADLRGRLHFCAQAQAVICHRLNLNRAEEEQFWVDSAVRRRAASTSPAHEEEERGKFSSYLSWLREGDQAAATNSAGDQQFACLEEDAAHADTHSGSSGAGGDCHHLHQHCVEAEVAQSGAHRGEEGAPAVNSLAGNMGPMSVSGDEAIRGPGGEQMGRADCSQPWAMQSPVQNRQRPIAEAVDVTSASVASLADMPNAACVSRLSSGSKRKAAAVEQSAGVATTAYPGAAKRLKFEVSLTAHAANTEQYGQQSGGAGGHDMDGDGPDDVEAAAACLVGMLGMQRRVLKVKRPVMKNDSAAMMQH